MATPRCDHHPDAVCSLCRYLNADASARAARQLAVMRMLANKGLHEPMSDQMIRAIGGKVSTTPRVYVRDNHPKITALRWYTDLFGKEASIEGREDIADYSEFA